LQERKGQSGRLEAGGYKRRNVDYESVIVLGGDKLGIRVSEKNKRGKKRSFLYLGF
jgi:hypothetical protein